MIRLANELQNVKTVAISGHIRPDGDCTGACLAVRNYILENYPAVQADVYLEMVNPKFLFLKGADEVITDDPQDKAYDLFISLDASDKERLGGARRIFDKAARTLCIDHHITNPGFAEVNEIHPEASSTCELVFELLEEERISRETAEALYVGLISDTGVFQYSNTTEKTLRAAGKLISKGIPFTKIIISRETAEALYVGLISDTGVFQYSNTTEKTLRAAGKLISKGIPFTKIIEETFYQKTYVQNQVLGRALLESILLLDGRVIVGRIRQKDMEFYGVGPADLEGIVSQLRVTEGVEVAIFLYETGNQEYKVSLRSNGPVDVSAVCAYFGGGGHVKAAGCTMHGTLHDVINNLMLPIENQLQETYEAGNE